MPWKSKEKQKEYRQKNREKYLVYLKNYRIENKDKIKAMLKKWHEKNKDYCKEYCKKYQLKNKNRIRKMQKKYEAKNKERLKSKKLLWQKENRKENRVRYNMYKYKAYHTNVHHKLKEILRQRIRSAIKENRKPQSAIKSMGCSIEELKKYLENKFVKGMTWENWSYNGWHIDHIKPLSKFDLTDKDEFLKACHYTNLQPLWAKDNLQKSNK